jgi:hypothetical protein
MQQGTCKLCLQEKQLVSSHLMPRALYQYCYKDEHRPIKYGDGFLLPTDRQTQDYLLCENCEDILNKGGESWIADKLATWERRFPLYDTLTKFPPDFNEDGMVVYFAVKNPEIKIDQLAHFALGLFWKASVHPWKAGRIEPRIELGPYSEEIRKWLRGEGAFPKNVYLIAVVERPARAQIALNDPYESGNDGWRSFFTHVPGLLFMLAVGKTVDEGTRVLCMQNSPGNPINLSEGLTDKYEQLMAETVQQARKTNAYLKAKAKVDKARRK